MKNSFEHVQIRKWTVNDFSVIREILRITWIDTYNEFIPEADLQFYLNQTYNDENLIALFHNPLTMFYLVEINSQVAGIMRVSNSVDEKRFYLNSLYVLPEYQGYGIGKQLSILAENLAIELGYDKIWLGVMEQNTSAVEWYKKSGYVFPEKEPFKMGNTSVIHFIGYKIIQEQK